MTMKTVKTAENTNTASVSFQASLRLGQVVFLSSAHESLKYFGTRGFRRRQLNPPRDLAEVGLAERFERLKILTAFILHIKKAPW
jgi:hypothetical protein